jgi:hypothetical protein
VARPIKKLDVRLVGLDDAPAGHIKCSIVSVDASGVRCARVSLPVAAATTLLAKRQIAIGWVSVCVRLIPPNAARCYRCLMPGHVAVRCKGKFDRSEECYRCGRKGHKAAQCEAVEPHCTTCMAAKRPATHRSGSKAYPSAIPAHKKGRNPRPV